MRNITFVTDAASIQVILAHIAEPARPPPLAPARKTPAWATDVKPPPKSRILKASPPTSMRWPNPSPSSSSTRTSPGEKPRAVPTASARRARTLRAVTGATPPARRKRALDRRR